MKLDISVRKNSVAIVGWHEGGAGQVHAWLEKLGNYHIACFVNPTDEPLEVVKIPRDATQFSYPTEKSFKDKPLINSSNWVGVLKDLGIHKVLVTTSDVHQRFEQINQAREKGMELINAIHPTALIMEDAILYDNVILHARTFVGYRAEIFSGAVIASAHLDHHNVVKECATIDPGVVCAGNVTIGRFAQVHTGVVIKNRIRIGENAIIGAGTVVIKDVPDNVTIVSVPAEAKRSFYLKRR